jgi:hypothetical protein
MNNYAYICIMKSKYEHIKSFDQVSEYIKNNSDGLVVFSYIFDNVLKIVFIEKEEFDKIKKLSKNELEFIKIYSEIETFSISFEIPNDEEQYKKIRIYNYDIATLLVIENDNQFYDFLANYINENLLNKEVILLNENYKFFLKEVLMNYKTLYNLLRKKYDVLFLSVDYGF